MNYRKHKRNYKSNLNFISTNNNNNTDPLEINQSNSNRINSNINNFQQRKILCVFQKTSINEKCIGISHTELNSQEGCKIYTGDYPLYALDSFELFISNYQPDIILLHSHPDHKITQIFSSESFDSKLKIIPYMNIQHNIMTTLLNDYFALKLNVSQIYLYTKVSDILSSLSSSSLSAMYTIFNLVIKNQSNSLDIMSSDLISFNKIIFNDILFISSKTQKELKIFEEKLHPSLVKGQGKSKEGCSLFNLLNKCQTAQGKKLIKTFFLFPLQNEEKIQQRYDCINSFIKMTNFGFVKSIMAELSNIKDLDVSIRELQKFMINFKVWKNIFYSFNAILKIFELFKGKNEQFKLLWAILIRINQENIEKVYDFICNCLEISKEEIRPKIKLGINELLDQLRNEFGGLDELLSKYALEYMKRIEKGMFMEKFMFVFLPQLGYMLCVEKNNKYRKFISKVYAMYCRKEYLINEEYEVDKIKFRFKIMKETNENNNNNIEFDSTEYKKIKHKLNHSNTFSSKQNTSISCNNNHNNFNEIIEEEDHLSQNDDYNANNIQKTRNINKNNDNNNESDEEEDYELHNSEETLILEQLTFSELSIQFQFHSTEMIYFKNEITNQLDKDYGDLAARITDIENAIFREISKQILEFEKDILLTNDFIAHLDIFINFYLLSEKYTLTQPIIANYFSLSNNQDKIIKSSLSFDSSRNLISELINESKYMKNSFQSENKSLFLITGHVSSGKSVYLRMVGMLAYLAQIGCYVPAKVFCYDIFTKILSNIEISESSADHMSGFTLEIKELKAIVDIITLTLSNNCHSDNNNNNGDVGNIEEEIEENLLVLLDDPFKRSSIHNQNCLIGGTLQHLNNLIVNNKNKNKKVKIFISLSLDSMDFLNQHNMINDTITSCYEMKTIINDGKMVNLFTIKQVMMHCSDGDDYNHNNLSKNNTENIKEKVIGLNGDGCKLFIAKENGLDDQLFLRAFEILNVFKMNNLLFPDLTKINKIIQRFIMHKGDLKSSLISLNNNNNNIPYGIGKQLDYFPNINANKNEEELTSLLLNEDILFEKLNQLFI